MVRAFCNAITFCVIAQAVSANPLSAHHPDRECQPVYPRIDVIGPVGNRLPAGHRRRLNRPSHWEGKLLYKIAPSSREAMAWHAAEHKGYYDCDAPRMETQYFYAKPYERLRIGSRVPRSAETSKAVSRKEETESRDDELPTLEEEIDENEEELEEVEDLPEPAEGDLPDADDAVSFSEPSRTLGDWLRGPRN